MEENGDDKKKSEEIKLKKKSEWDWDDFEWGICLEDWPKDGD